MTAQSENIVADYIPTAAATVNRTLDAGMANNDTDNGSAPAGIRYNIDEDAVAIAVPLVFSLIFVVGLIGNGCVIGAVVRYKAMRTAPNVFIVNLAVGDVLMILISVPTSALVYTLHSWPFGHAVCKISYFIKTLSLGVSIFTLTALSIDRVLVISRTWKLRTKSSSRIRLMVLSVWLVSILVAIPDAVSYHLQVKHYPDITFTVCRPHPPHWSKNLNYDKIHATAHITLFFILPLIIIAICYGIMAHVMIKSSRGLPGESKECSTWRAKQMETRKRVAAIAIVLIVLFFLCWLPRSVFVMFTFYGPKAQMMTPAIYYFKIVGYCLQFLNCCVNPIALYFLSKMFKTHYMKQLCCGRDGGRASDTDLATRQSQLAPVDSQPMVKITQQQKFPRNDQTDNTELMT